MVGSGIGTRDRSPGVRRGVFIGAPRRAARSTVRGVVAMPDIEIDLYDDTSTDYEHHEKALLAEDRDAAGVRTADVGDTVAQQLVSDLVERKLVTPLPEGRVLVHEPSGRAFESITQLAVFHRGWTAVRTDDEREE